MEFPHFDNINADYSANNIPNSTFFSKEDEIEIDNMEFNNNNHQNFNDNYIPNNNENMNYNNMAWNNNPIAEGNFSSLDDGLDEDEKKRIQERRQEEEERRAKIIKKMNDELRIKQEFRDKARDYVENWRMYYFLLYFYFKEKYYLITLVIKNYLFRTRENNIRKRHEFNINNEKDFVNNRDLIKEDKKNPWEKVMENIEIKESDYKGTKDVSRMRTVIVNRKGDFTQMKMK